MSRSSSGKWLSQFDYISCCHKAPEWPGNDTILCSCGGDLFTSQTFFLRISLSAQECKMWLVTLVLSDFCAFLFCQITIANCHEQDPQEEIWGQWWGAKLLLFLLTILVLVFPQPLQVGLRGGALPGWILKLDFCLLTSPPSLLWVCISLLGVHTIQKMHIDHSLIRLSAQTYSQGVPVISLKHLCVEQQLISVKTQKVPKWAYEYKK